MAAQGTTTVDFGAFPGKSDIAVAVTGQTGIVGTSLVEAWIFPTATADHSADEHWAENITVNAGSIVAGTGFTIYVRTQPVGNGFDQPRLYGRWTIAWVWN